MATATMEEAFVKELSALYNGEKLALGGLNQMAQAVSTPAAKQIFEQHQQESQQQVQRLEQIFQQLGKEPDQIIPDGIQGILHENEKIQQQGYEGPVLDSAIIAAAQRLEHYEIAGYGTAVTHAKQSGNQPVADLLAQTLQEEKQADEKLTQVAESSVNPQAVQAA